MMTVDIIASRDDVWLCAYSIDVDVMENPQWKEAVAQATFKLTEKVNGPEWSANIVQINEHILRRTNEGKWLVQ